MYMYSLRARDVNYINFFNQLQQSFFIDPSSNWLIILF